MTHSEFIKTKYFPNLDFLRFLAISTVVWYHTAEKIEPTSIGVLRYGFAGVWLFFVVSGFLITSLLLRELRNTKTLDLKLFLIRRALRIFPLYYLVLLLYVVLVSVLEPDGAAKDSFFDNLPFFLTYTSNLFVPLTGERTIFYFSWSLAVEEQYYLVWPLILLLLGWRWGIIILSALVALVIFNFLVGFGETGMPNQLLMNAIHLPILLGSLLALTMDNKFGFGLVKKLAGFPYSVIIYSALLVYTYELGVQVKLLAPIVMTLFVASFVLHTDKNLVSVTNFSLFRHVGVVSYGVYLFHMLGANFVDLVINRLELELFPFLFFIAVLSISVVVSSISFYTFERYFINLKSHFYPKASSSKDSL